MAGQAADAPANPFAGLYEFIKGHLVVVNNLIAFSCFAVGALDFMAPKLWLLPRIVYSCTAMLAAAMLAAAGWRGTNEQGGALHDPCCGSGTIPIEAALIACDAAPGLQRRFAFEHQLPFATPAMKATWGEMAQAARARIHPPAVPIYASDVAFRMVDFARRNAERAGVAQYIQFNGGDALERPAPQLPEGMPGSIVMNPPYGERIEVRGKAAMTRDAGGSEERDAGDDFFPRLAAHWKRQYTGNPAGWTAWMLSPDMKLPGRMRLKESRRVPMWNGPIECRLFRFDLVKGSARKPAEGDAPA